MGRPLSLASYNNDTCTSATLTSGTVYDAACRMTNWTYGSYSYNANGQMTSDGVMQYSYSATQNNGQITQLVNYYSGETVNYQYDALKRLTEAHSVPTAGTTPAAWLQQYQYDGFGNLTAKILNGTTTTISTNAATNQAAGSYDASGNMYSGAGGSMSYDGMNRMLSYTPVSGGTEYYGYAPDNKRIYRRDPVTLQESVTLWGAMGEKIGTYTLWGGINALTPGVFTLTPQAVEIRFAGRKVGTFADRVGTEITSTQPSYKPYGENTASFATYDKDGFSGIHYADQRYYNSAAGRFNTADPYQASAGAGDPGSWNRYAYVGGDPVNKGDPRGLCSLDYGGGWWDEDVFGTPVFSGPCSANSDWCTSHYSGFSYNGTSYDSEVPYVRPFGPDSCYNAGSSGVCAGTSGGDGGGSGLSDQTGATGKTPNPFAAAFLKNLARGLKALKSFKVKAGSQCATDLAVLGLSSQSIRNYAGGGATFTDAHTLAQNQIEDNSDFFLLGAKTNTIFYNTDFAIDEPLSLMLGTLVQELGHVRGLTDQDIAKSFFADPS